MKKIILFFTFLMLLAGCSNSKVDNLSNENYSGKVTEESKKYLDKGIIFNVYRSVDKLGDDAENYNKGYIKIVYNVITDYYSTNDYNPDASYNIKKKIVSNLRVIKGPKMGIADELYGNFSLYDERTNLLGTNNKFEQVYDTPHMSGVQSSIAVFVNKVALLDANKYTDAEISDLSKIYGDLGISRDSVALTLGFRVELITVDNKTYYKDYVVEIPTKNFNISGSEFQIDLTTDDIDKMEPFLEK